jgi:hypothetical protein
MTTVNRRPRRAELRKFAVAMLIGFGVLGAVAWLITERKATGSWFTWSGGPTWPVVVLWLAGLTLAGSTLLPYPVARGVYVAWMTGASWIGVVMSHVVLTLLYFVLLPPFSLIVRWKDSLRRRLEPGKSYWEPCEPSEPTMERMRRMF